MFLIVDKQYVISYFVELAKLVEKYFSWKCNQIKKKNWCKLPWVYVKLIMSVVFKLKTMLTLNRLLSKKFKNIKKSNYLNSNIQLHIFHNRPTNFFKKYCWRNMEHGTCWRNMETWIKISFKTTEVLYVIWCTFVFSELVVNKSNIIILTFILR